MIIEAQKQEPVAIVNGAFANRIEWKCTSRSFPADGTLLYTSPPQRQPLSLQELKDLWNAQADEYNQFDELGLDEIVAFTQAAHGIKGEA